MLYYVKGRFTGFLIDDNENDLNMGSFDNISEDDCEPTKITLGDIIEEDIPAASIITITDFINWLNGAFAAKYPDQVKGIFNRSHDNNLNYTNPEGYAIGGVEYYIRDVTSEASIELI